MASRLMLFPGEHLVFGPNRRPEYLRVFIVDYEVEGGWATCTCILRDKVPADVTWRGSRLPGFIFKTDAEDVHVDLAAAELGALP